MIFIVRVSDSERLSNFHKIFINVKIFDSSKISDYEKAGKRSRISTPVVMPDTIGHPSPLRYSLPGSLPHCSPPNPSSSTMLENLLTVPLVNVFLC